MEVGSSAAWLTSLVLIPLKSEAERSRRGWTCRCVKALHACLALVVFILGLHLAYMLLHVPVCSYKVHVRADLLCM